MDPSSDRSMRVGRKLNVLLGANRRDIAVVLILWSSILFDPWMSDWDEQSLVNLFDDVETLSSAVVRLNLVLVLVFKCTLCIALSLLADTRDRKYFAYIICLCVYFITPLIGLLAYSEQTVQTSTMVPWGLSFMFICHPAQLCAIFSQMPYVTRKFGRFLSSLLVFAACMSIYIASLSFEDTLIRHRRRMVLVTLIFTLLAFAIVIPITVYLKNYVRPEVVVEKSVKRLFQGIRQDMKADLERNNVICRVPKNAVKVIIFLSLCIPVLLSNIIHAYIFQIDGNDQGTNLDSTTVGLVIFWEVVAIPLVEIIFQIVNKLSEKTAGVLNLGLPHMMNMAAVLLIFIDFTFISTKSQATGRILLEDTVFMEETVGPIPAPKTKVYEFYNMMNDTVIVTSKYFELQVKAWKTSAYTVVDVEKSFEVTLKGHSKRPKFRPTTIKVRGNFGEIISYVIKGDGNNSRILEVVGHQRVRPVSSPVLIIMNTFVKINESGHWFQIKDTKSNFSQIFPAPHSNKSVHLFAPASSLMISYTTGRSANTRLLEASESLHAQSYSVYTLLFDKIDKKIFPHSYLIMQLVRRDDHRSESDVDNLDAKNVQRHHQTHYLILAAFGLHGATLGVMQVGYIHHFWIDAPIRLRASVLAAFQVADTLTDRLLHPHLGNFGKQESYTILIIQIVATSWHLVLAGIYYFCFDLRHPGKIDSPISAINTEDAMTTSNIRLNPNPNSAVAERSEKKSSTNQQPPQSSLQSNVSTQGRSSGSEMPPVVRQMEQPDSDATRRPRSYSNPGPSAR